MAGTQLTLSTSCKSLMEPSKCLLKQNSIRPRSIARVARARVRGHLGSLPSPGSSGITKATAAGSSTIRLSQGKADSAAGAPRLDAASRGMLTSITARLQIW